MQPPRADSKTAPKTEQVHFVVTRDEKEHLRVAARDEGMSVSDLITRDLGYLFSPGGKLPRSLSRQLRLWFLTLRGDNLQAQKGLIASQRRDVERRLASLDPRRSAKREGAELRARAGELAREEAGVDELIVRNELDKDRVRATPKPASARQSFQGVFAVPLFLAMSPVAVVALRAILLFLFLAGAALLVVWLVRRRRTRKASAPKKAGLASRLRAAARVAAGASKKDDVPPEVAAALDKGEGLNPREIKDAFLTDPRFMIYRLRRMLEQEDGLEKLRKALEDAELDWIDDEGRITELRVIVATHAEWTRLPMEFKLSTLSERSRGWVPPDLLRSIPPAAEKGASALDDEDEEEGEDEPAPAAPAAPPRRRGRPRGSTKEAMEARRRALEAGREEAEPGILPHQPPKIMKIDPPAHANGNGNGNGNGAHAASEESS